MPAYRVELHSHCQGDPVDSYLSHSIFEQIDQARRVGLDALAVTWHRKVCAHAEAEAYARDRGILLIPGMEAEIDRKHVVVLNIEPADLPPETTWDEIRALRQRKPEAFVLAPHPFYPHPSCLGRALGKNADCIDAVEWCILHLDWLPGGLNPNLRAARWARKHGKALVACSDAHKLSILGQNASTVIADELTPASIFAGIRAGRVTFPRRGLSLLPLVSQAVDFVVAQPRHARRWARAKLESGRRQPARALH
jgi:predicted metal-dependent phosphoesterase TrpH